MEYLKVCHAKPPNGSLNQLWFPRQGREKQHKSKQAGVFTEEHLANFIAMSDNLTFKVAMIFGHHGMLRISEVRAIEWPNVTKEGDHYKIFVPKSKSDQAKNGRSKLNHEWLIKSVMVFPTGWEFFITGANCAYIDDYVERFTPSQRIGEYTK